MADEQAQADVTAEVAIPEQTTEVRQEAPPEPATPAAPEAPAEPDRGDPRVAMMEERRKRQEYERLASDPQWVYEQARKLGLAQEETPSFAPQPPASPQAPTATDVGAIVAHQLDFERTIEKYPEFDPKRGDKALVKWAASLVDDGHRPSEAVDIIRKTIEKHTVQATKEAVTEHAAAQAQAESAKVAAGLMDSTASSSADALELEELQRQARNWKDPKSQESAHLELLKRRMRT